MANSKKLDKAWFKQWYQAMPVSWQAGLHEAIKGSAFRGDLETPTGQADVAVFFVPAEYADAVEAFITGSPPAC